MPKVRLLTSFAGKLGEADSPPAGAVVEVPQTVAKALIGDGRAEPLKGEKAVKPDTGEKRG